MPARLNLDKSGQPEAAPPWGPAEALGLALVLVLAAALRIWHLDRNGFGNAYYAAAVRSMLRNPHNFFFVSFDPAGWVTVDKPPLALWIQAASAKLFGYGGMSLLLPQAAEGVAGVALLYALVRRAFDRPAALGAALVLAAMPLSVAVDRYNNVDACLVFVLLLAAWAIARAVESGRRSWLLAAAVLGGLAFNTKMLMGFIFLPAFYATYLFAAPGSLRHRIREMALASALLAAVSLSWILAVDWTPAARRPFVGSSTDNSMVELSFMGWNGLQRFSRHRPGAAPASLSGTAGAGPESAAAESDAKTDPEPAQRGHRGGPRWGGGSPPGPFRLASPEWAAQVLWFIPLALLGLLAALRRGPRLRSAATGVHKAHAPSRGLFRAIAAAPGLLRQGLLSRPDRQALFFWSAWLAIHALIFSTFSVVHTYYLVLLAPAVAALSGIGLRALWLEYREGRKDLLLVAILATALWQERILAQNPDWNGALLPILAGGATLGALGLALAREKDPASGPSWPRVNLAVGAVALLVCPLGWALTPALSPSGGASVEADPTLVTGAVSPDLGAPRSQGMGRQGRGSADSDKLLLDFLVRHRGAAEYLVAAQNSQTVAPLIIASGEPAISIGGFMGRDPIVNADQFTAMVLAGKVRYFLLGRDRGRGQGGWSDASARNPWAGGPGGGGAEARQISQWVRSHGRAVDPRLWQAPAALQAAEASGGPSSGWSRDSDLRLYDLGVLWGNEGQQGALGKQRHGRRA